VESGGLKALITGVGVNVRRADRSLPAGAVPATCLEELLPAERFARLDPTRLMDELLDEIDAWYERLAAGRTADLHQACRSIYRT